MANGIIITRIIFKKIHGRGVLNLIVEKFVFCGKNGKNKTDEENLSIHYFVSIIYILLEQDLFLTPPTTALICASPNYLTDYINSVNR